MDTDKTDLYVDLSDLTAQGTNNTVWVDGHGDPYTITASSAPYSWPNNSPSYTFSDLSITSPPVSSKLSLKGDNADIEINGESVVGMLREIRDRLNILQVSAEMEQEWDDLRALREQYEAKLADCRTKSKMWNTLKR